MVPIARRLRRDATKAERILWRSLNGRQLEGFRFRRQAPLLGYVVDFMCYEARLVIEVDGATHSTDAELARDAARDEALRRSGNHVLRVQNIEVFENLDGVIETILATLHELRPRLETSIEHCSAPSTPHPVPLPQGERGR